MCSEKSSELGKVDQNISVSFLTKHDIVREDQVQCNTRPKKHVQVKEMK